MTPELLARAWAAGAGPGSETFTIDLDSTICDTYGLADPVAKRLDADLERAALAIAAYSLVRFLSRYFTRRALTPFAAPSRCPMGTCARPYL